MLLLNVGVVHHLYMEAMTNHSYTFCLFSKLDDAIIYYPLRLHLGFKIGLKFYTIHYLFQTKNMASSIPLVTIVLTHNKAKGSKLV